jgi:type 1 fimbria pilin
MRRWNPLFLVALLVVALLAAVLMTPRGALAAPSSLRQFPASSTNFKGKIVAKNSNTHYFVLSFTCSGGNLSAKWTYEVSSTSSFSGTVGEASCSFSSTDGLVTSPSPLNLVGAPCEPCTPTLTVTLTNIVATKTFFNVPTPTMLCSSSATPQPCLGVTTEGFIIPPSTTPDDFNSQCANFTCPAGFPFATLNLSAR